jgi:hypothetical protein
MTEECFVPPDKIKNYLLNFESEYGGPKAKFFTEAGFHSPMSLFSSKH